MEYVELEQAKLHHKGIDKSRMWNMRDKPTYFFNKSMLGKTKKTRGRYFAKML